MINKIFIFFLTFFTMLSFPVMAQWEKVLEVDDNNFYTIEALDHQTVLIAVEFANVIRSENGAQDFTNISLQPYGFIQSFSFVNDQVGYAGGGCYFVFDECPGNTIYKTLDAGETWTEVFNAMEDANFGVITAIETPDENKVFAISDNGVLYRSEDAGDIFLPIVIDSAVIGNISAGQIQFFDGENGIAVTRSSSSGQLQQHLYKTTDGADSWTLIYETGGNNLPAINNAFFVDAEHGFVCTNFGLLQMTDDGGMTWTPVTIGAQDEELRKVWFLNEQVGFVSSYISATQQTRLYRTEDGGEQWTVDLQMDSTFINDFHFVDEENAYAILGFRTLYKRSGTNAIHGVESETTLKMYPNPVREVLVFENEEEKVGYQLRMVDAIGRMVWSQSLGFGRHEVFVEEWSRGIYFWEVTDEKGKLVKGGKVVVK